MSSVLLYLLVFLLVFTSIICIYLLTRYKKKNDKLNNLLMLKTNEYNEQNSAFQQLNAQIQWQQKELYILNQFKEEKSKEIEKLILQIEQEKSELTQQKIAFHAQEYENKLHQKQIDSQKEVIQQLKTQLQQVEELKNQILLKSTQLEENNRYLFQRNEEQSLQYQNIQKENLTRFESLASKVLEQNTQQQNKELTGVLDPLKENIALFQKQVQEVYEKEEKRRFSLEEQVKQLMQLNHTLTSEAKKLSKALSTQSKVQGDWGELILEQILEYSGLQKNVHYFVQESIKDHTGKTITNALGKTMIPDVLVKYPGNRQLIIDAKCSIKDYMAWNDEEHQDLANIHLNQHLQSVKKHINDLSRKEYQRYLPSLDFVMMLLPNEGAYTAALSAAPNLWLEAYQKRVLLVSPSNLIASLKLIEHLWVKEEQDRNIQAIIERGTLLYEKVVGFVEDFNKIEIEIQRTHQLYDVAKNKLYSGRGNIIRQTEILKELGVNSNKEIPNIQEF